MVEVVDTIRSGRPRVCYLRGSYLNPFETQYLEPLTDRFEIVVAHSRSHRHDVSVIDLPRRELPCLDYLNGLLPRRLGGRALPNPLKFFGYEEVLLGLDAALADFDLVHLPEQTFFFTWQAIRRKARLKYRVVTTQAEVTPYWYEHRRGLLERAREVRSATDLFHARTQRAAMALECEGVDSERIRVIGHGVDLERFRPDAKDGQVAHALGVDLESPVILFVGRLVWTKGLWALADAAARLLREPDLRALRPQFVIAGGGPERRAFVARLQHLGIADRFRLIGNQPYAHMPNIHRLADIFVMPSISTRYVLEQFGIALIEALATATPVVSTYCGAIDEVVGEAGLLVQPNDGLRLYEALAALCRNPDLRRRLGAAGRRRAEAKFAHTTVADQLGMAYAAALAG